MPGEKREAIAMSYRYIKQGIKAIDSPQDQFLMAVSYANGTRVSEALKVRDSDIEIKERFVYITTPVLKKRGPIVPKRAPPISRELESWLTNIIIGYSKGKEGKLIRYGKRTAQRRFDQYFGCTSHSFRHTRATHCFKHFGMTMEKVRLYFRISPRSLADWIVRYGHLDRTDLEAHIRHRVAIKRRKKKRKEVEKNGLRYRKAIRDNPNKAGLPHNRARNQEEKGNGGRGTGEEGKACEEGREAEARA